MIYSKKKKKKKKDISVLMIMFQIWIGHIVSLTRHLEGLILMAIAIWVESIAGTYDLPMGSSNTAFFTFL